MAWFPEAIRKPLTADKMAGAGLRPRLTVFNRVNLHVAVSEGSSLFDFFNRSGRADSHFYVRKDGTVEQYVDTAFRAFADLEGNDATISIETQGGLNNPQGEPWTDAQVEALAKIYAWAAREHGVRVQIAQNSKVGDSSKGLSWHRLGIDGNFPALPDVRAGRIQRGGGMRYSGSFGKVCPGDEKIRQADRVFARANEILGGAAPAPAPAPVPVPVVPAPAPGVNYNPNNYDVAYVKEVQERLNDRNYRLVTDGILGAITFAAIKDFQSKHGLVVDGIPGPNTLSILRSVTPPPARAIEGDRRMQRTGASDKPITPESTQLTNEALEQKIVFQCDEIHFL